MHPVNESDSFPNFLSSCLEIGGDFLQVIYIKGGLSKHIFLAAIMLS